MARLVPREAGIRRRLDHINEDEVEISSLAALLSLVPLRNSVHKYDRLTGRLTGTSPVKPFLQLKGHISWP